MQKLIVVLLVLFLMGCSINQNRTIEITPVVPEENSSVPEEIPPPVENVTEEPKPIISDPAAKEQATQICLDSIEFKIEKVCLDDAGLRVKVENKGDAIDHFEVKVRDLFENEFYDVGTLPGLKEDQTASLLVPNEKLENPPYRLQLKPVVKVGTVEFSCTPATEIEDAGDREEFHQC